MDFNRELRRVCYGHTIDRVDGAGTHHFHKVREHTGGWGQRVTTWRIEW